MHMYSYPLLYMYTPLISGKLALRSSNMLPLQHCDELLDLDVDVASLENRNLNKKRQKRSRSCSQENKYEENFDLNLKKIMHRDIERQRRKEMASLYGSLRSLLPLEYIRGKRSISDHMHEALNYIKHMERNIKELQIRRDKLKNLYMFGGTSANGSSNSVNLPNCVTVSSCLDGFEILISCDIKVENRFLLSSVLVALIQTGLDIVSCISNKANDRILYRIQTQVNDLKYINLPELQQRLVNVVNSG